MSRQTRSNVATTSSLAQNGHSIGRGGILLKYSVGGETVKFGRTAFPKRLIFLRIEPAAWNLWWRLEAHPKADRNIEAFVLESPSIRSSAVPRFPIDKLVRANLHIAANPDLKPSALRFA
jgi:hypothetical protein